MSWRLTAVLAMVLVSPAFSQESPVTTRMVTLDGVSIRVRHSDVSKRAPRQPVVVFENGAGIGLETWDKVLPDIANDAPVFSYDRPGTGKSDWNGQPLDYAAAIDRLKRLLMQLDVSPPYVLVGHSWGGALMRFYAGAYPSDVAGVVYVDPTDVMMSRADLVGLFKAVGGTSADYDAFEKTMDSFTPPAGPMRAESNAVMALINSDPASRKLPSAPRVPSSVVLASRVGALPPKSVPFDVKAHAQAFQDFRVARLRSWATNGGTFEIATGAGHFVQTDDPARVIAAIRALIAPKK